MKNSVREQPYRRPIGLFEALSATKTLQKYLDLIMIENFSYIHDTNDRDMLFKKYPSFFIDEKLQPNFPKIHKEINRLTVRVYHYLRRINAPTSWSASSKDLEYDYEKEKRVMKEKTEHYDIILERQFPVFRSKKGFNDADTTYPVLQQSIAVYDSAWKKYWLKIINPLWWIAFILRLPISLMEHMGMNTESVNINKFVYWLIQAIVLFILSFVALRLGIQIDIPYMR